jgi:3-isopropylmalate/(R)-2-methylmalate dehydratase small subunit
MDLKAIGDATVGGGGLRRIRGRAYPLGRDNVDTDLIIPARHLKTIVRAGLGRFAFEALRQDPCNIFDDPRFARAPILIAGANFGCGSSREHAAWALADMGVRAVVAKSFSDIFAGNACRNGIAAIAVHDDELEKLLDHAGNAIEIDLELQSVSVSGGALFSFSMDPFRKRCLVEGLDEIDVTLEHEALISDYERREFGPPPVG